MAQTKYSMSFTTATLLHQESILVATLFRQLADWETVRTAVLAENQLHMRTLNASKRIFSEITSRLKQLTPAEMEALLDGDFQEQDYLLWLAYCKRYRFVYDFAVEVMREKFLRLDSSLTYHDYDIFFQNKAEWHPEVERVAAATRLKQRQVLFRVLREIGLLTADNHLIPTFLSPRLTAVIAQDDPAHLRLFLIPETDIKTWIG